MTTDEQIRMYALGRAVETDYGLLLNPSRWERNIGRKRGNVSPQEPFRRIKGHQDRYEQIL